MGSFGVIIQVDKEAAHELAAALALGGSFVVSIADEITQLRRRLTILRLSILDPAARRARGERGIWWRSQTRARRLGRHRNRNALLLGVLRSS